MLVFDVFKFFLVETMERGLFVEEASENLIERAQDVLDRLITGDRPFPIRYEKSEKTIIPLDNEVMCKIERVSLMLVCNQKHKKYQDKKDDKDLEYHPGCYVIVDNRDGIANIVIERTSAFDSNPDKVAILLEKAINDKFRSEQIPLKIVIKSKVQEATLWEMVDRQVNEYHDRVTRVSFHFPVPGKVAGIDASNDMKGRLQVLATIAGSMNGSRASYAVEADPNSSLRLNQADEDLAQMVHLCSRNVYDISVHFQKYGVFRFGSDVKAQSSLDDRIIEDFKNLHKALLINGEEGFELVEWLDNVRGITNDFKNIQPNAKRRKKRSEAAV